MTSLYEVGEIRPSQLLYSFGIGALLDLPNMSVMIMGLDEWPAERCDEIAEERLLDAIRKRSSMEHVSKLRKPPYQPETHLSSRGAPLGVPVTPFPRWMRCPRCRKLLSVDEDLVQLRTDRFYPEKTRYVHHNCQVAKQPTVLPVRFLVACEKGHIDDFPWDYFVHHGRKINCRQTFQFEEYGVSGEASSIRIKCTTCNDARRLTEAIGLQGQANLPACRGRNPHLRGFDPEPCAKPLKTISLGASNAWFGVTLSALSLPYGVTELDGLINSHWNDLKKATSLERVGFMREFELLKDFHTFTDAEVWEAIQKYRQQHTSDVVAYDDLKAPEWQVLLEPEQVNADLHFKAVTEASPPTYRDLIDQVVLIERLREVRALLGFTRITSFGDLEDVQKLQEIETASLSRDAPTWLPASEIHGEGIFLRFNETAIQTWLQRPEVQIFDRELERAHYAWYEQRNVADPVAYPGARFALLHTFAHALMRQLSLACGYSLASIRERIYALDSDDAGGPMAGVLLYTAAPGSEGTLGGLVGLGKASILDEHITRALESIELCASDPLCAESEITDLHGAACHACMFMPETSCERGNRYLDRSLLVPTIEQKGLNFFGSKL